MERAESVLLLRCIEVNGDWDEVFAFSQRQRLSKLQAAKAVRIGSKTPTPRPRLDKKTEEARRRRKQKAVAA